MSMRPESDTAVPFSVSDTAAPVKLLSMMPLESVSSTSSTGVMVGEAGAMIALIVGAAVSMNRL